MALPTGWCSFLAVIGLDKTCVARSTLWTCQDRSLLGDQNSFLFAEETRTLVPLAPLAAVKGGAPTPDQGEFCAYSFQGSCCDKIEEAQEEGGEVEKKWAHLCFIPAYCTIWK